MIRGRVHRSRPRWPATRATRATPTRTVLGLRNRVLLSHPEIPDEMPNPTDKSVDRVKRRTNLFTDKIFEKYM